MVHKLLIEQKGSKQFAYELKLSGDKFKKVRVSREVAKRKYGVILGD